MKKNGITDTSFLLGSEEAKAFEAGRYVALHQSTLGKVRIIASIAERQWKGKLKTEAGWKEIYGTRVEGLADLVTNHWLFKLIGFISIIITLITGIPFIWNLTKDLFS